MEKPRTKWQWALMQDEMHTVVRPTLFETENSLEFELYSISLFEYNKGPSLRLKEIQMCRGTSGKRAVSAPRFVCMKTECISEGGLFLIQKGFSNHEADSVKEP